MRPSHARSSDTIWDAAVIGGGPSGMMAAGRAAELGAKVILIEKNPSLGKKLLLTGGGRCNVTNAEFDDRKLLGRYEENGKFLFSAFSQWSVKETLDFFNSRGMATKVENEKRVFPVSDSSRSVLDVLLAYMKEGSVSIRSNSPVKELKTSRAFIEKSPLNNASAAAHDNQIASVLLENGDEIYAKSFIIATGGKSYPQTGSTGDGFPWLRKLGHTVIKPDSALVPVNIRDKWVRSLQGVTLPEVKLSIFQDGKKIEVKRGKILFTHFGVSGPTVLNMSGRINELLSYGDVFISLDAVPNLDFSSLNDALQNLFKENSNKKFKNALPNLVASSLVPAIVEISEINGETFCNGVTREDRVRLMHILKDTRMQVDSLASPEKAIVSSGGVALDEVDFKSMRSKIVPNLYLTGDILNINRPSGGFSLQLCWTTGFVAGTGSVGKKASTSV